MKHKIAYIIVLFPLLSCSSQETPTATRFNEGSKEFFLRAFESFDLSPLDDREKCVLKKTIENDLEKISGSKITILHDRYYIKAYYEDYLQLHFSFIKDIETKKIYFLAVPSLDEFIYEVERNYRRKNDSIYHLQLGRDAIMLNTSLLSPLFSRENFDVALRDDQEFYRKHRLATEILEEAFSILVCNKIDVSRFQDIIDADLRKDLLSQSAFDNLMQLTERIKDEKPQALSPYYVQGAGYILLQSHLDYASSKINVRLYFLPDFERRRLSRWITTPYKDCLQLTR